MRRCWRCGQQESTGHVNGEGCSIIPTELREPMAVIPGLEKIEPLKLRINFADLFSNDGHLENKLNEVIEAVNKMMEVMNRRVK